VKGVQGVFPPPYNIVIKSTLSIFYEVIAKLSKNLVLKSLENGFYQFVFPQFLQVCPSSPLNSLFFFFSSLSFSKSRVGKKIYPHINGENPLSKVAYTNIPPQNCEKFESVLYTNNNFP
jgi:hypothetical protein